jgi:hypothetical protein
MTTMYEKDQILSSPDEWLAWLLLPKEQEWHHR